MDPIEHYVNLETRRKFLGKLAMGFGTAAMSSLLPGRASAATSLNPPGQGLGNGMLGATHFAPKAKRGI